ncbi:cytochrome c biogenesis CcdA family protein [Paenibacillus sp. y28]|uniref:cytochrome c biogenesis CcdA family protein n=1 Tax=Paenibacillus sp. y28 TaxID=3129110 RepID=UPI003016BB06
MDQITIWIALWAGFASFISPCCLPLYPSYLSYITGISVSKLKDERSAREVRLTTMGHTLCFIIGFSLVFYTLGYGVNLVADLFYDYKDAIRQVAALLILIMGLVLLGVLQPQWLMRDMKFQFKNKPAGYFGSLVIGIGFAAGWSPCVGPILGGILGLAATSPSDWFTLMTAYSIGFAVPFFVLSFFIGTTKWILRYSGALMKAGGALMIVIAVLLFTDRMLLITVWLQERTPDWLKF